MFWYMNAFRRWAIRRLAGRMEVCLNMNIVNGYVEYGGRFGGAICEGNAFIVRS
jgi:hypothetical protein